jgi:hypothetical protein
MDTNDQIITSVIDAHVQSGQPEGGDDENGQPGVRVPARKINNNSRQVGCTC